MLSRLLRQTLFTLVHLVVNVLVAIQNVYYRFWVKKSNSRSGEMTKSDIKMILDSMPKMKKKLKHLVMLTNTEHHSMSDLAFVLIWSLVAGIPYVSFYDITGELKENEEKLFLEVEQKKKGIPGCIKWSEKPDLNGYTNGIRANTVIVNIFTSCDGQGKIAQCVKRIAEDKIKLKNSEELTTQDLDEALAVVYPSIPDPDLVLYTGSLCCTHGLLPWQIRLTEFLKLSLDHNVNIDCYLGALFKYNKCDQRFGK